MYNKLLTNRYRVGALTQLIDTLRDGECYVGVGQHLPIGDDSVAATATGSENELQQTYSNLIMGQRLDQSDIVPMIGRNTWTTGQVFQAYSQYKTTNCFVVVEQGSTKYVYKCLSNNLGQPSTQIPSGTLLEPFVAADGYVWQYMFTIPENTFTRFSTATHIPFVEDAAVTAGSTAGTIDAVDIVDPGTGYTNVLTGTLRAEDLPTGTLQTIKLAGGSTTNNFYVGSVIEIVTPTSPAAEQMRTIVGYSGTTKIATLDSALSASPEAGDAFEVSPGVQFETNVLVTSPAVARALVEDGKITSIVFQSRGEGYRETTATVAAHSSVGATPAQLQVNVSPARGHGSNILEESSAIAVGIHTYINADDAGVEKTNDFRTAVLLDAPKFTGVEATLDSGNAERFSVGETVSRLTFNGDIDGAVTFTSPATFTGNTVSLSAGSQVLITSGSQQLVVNITSVSNSTHAAASSNFSGTFTGDGQVIVESTVGEVVSVNGSTLTLKNVSPTLTPGVLYGQTSRARDTITAIDINGRANLDTFNQTTRFTGTTTGTLQENELMTSNGKSAAVFSVNAGQTVVATTNTELAATGTYTGQSSGATFNATSLVGEELVVDSGRILAVNNFTPISISPNKKISTKFLIEF